MTTKTLIAAAALSILPAMAFATSVPITALVPIADDGTTEITGANSNLFTFNVDVDSGNFQHTFELAGAGEASGKVTLDSFVANLFDGLVAQWLSTDGTVLATSSPDDTDSFSVATTFADPDSLVQILSISWDGAPKGVPIFDGTVRVSSVPVPAGLLLMGTALAGLGLTRRKA